MSAVADTVAAAFLFMGLFFMFVSALGLLRMPDTFLRLHAATKATTLGLVGLLLGAVFHIGTGDVAAKSAAAIVFAFVAAPIGSHLLAKAAMRRGAPQWRQTVADEHEEDGVH